MALVPQVVVTLVLLTAAFGLAAIPAFRRPSPRKGARLALIVPRPDQPSSMLSFSALPTFLLLLTLARFGLFMVPAVDPVNSPESNMRYRSYRYEVELGPPKDPNSSHRFDVIYPHNTADLTADAARRMKSADEWKRARAIGDLAWWTGVCPNYAPFALPKLTTALRDPDPGVKGAAAIGLGTIGGNAASAIPALLAARGTSVRYFDNLVDEAVALIESSPSWPPEKECEEVSVKELERRAARRVPQPRKSRGSCAPG